MIPRLAAALLIFAMSIPGLAAAQPAEAGLAVTEHARYGRYLTDGEGHALYMFSKDTRGTDGQAPTIFCADTCLEIWTPFFSQAEPQAAEGVDAAKIGLVDLNGKSMVTYNGWPLYTYISDNMPGETDGQGNYSFIGTWSLVTPEGEAVTAQ